MACYNPMVAERTTDNSVKFVKSHKSRDYLLHGNRFLLPCSQCIGCRLERSRQWAVRCMHEASLYENNCFLTLTYDNHHLPENKSLVLDDLQRFLKRLRKKYSSRKIRFYACGEYGDLYKRPHYHVCLFNFDFEDKKLFKSRNDIRLYTSDILQSLWNYGLSSVGSLTFESAAYVARYITKKITGKDAKDYYKDRKPEFNTMSRRGGIGQSWIDQNYSDVYPADRVVVRGKECRPPRYYDFHFEKIAPHIMQELKDQRLLRADKYKFDQTEKRLAVKEKCKYSQFKLLIRDLEREI